MLKNVSFLDVPKCSATLEVSIARCQSVVCVAVPKLSPRLLAQLLPSFCPAPAQLLPSCPPPILSSRHPSPISPHRATCHLGNWTLSNY